MSEGINNPIEQRNTGRGNPNAVFIFDEPLNNRQQSLLAYLVNYDDVITVKKSTVNMKDLSALTAKEGVEFALFTRKNERMVVRGGRSSVNINVNKAKELNGGGWRWSGHTHPGVDDFSTLASREDKMILNCFSQNESAIYNSKGRFSLFDKEV